VRIDNGSSSNVSGGGSSGGGVRRLEGVIGDSPVVEGMKVLGDPNVPAG